MSQDGALLQWGYTQATGLDEDESKGETDSTSKWKIVQRHYFMQANAKIKCASYHASTKLLTVGFSNGMFSLHELPDFNLIHTLR